MLSLPDLFNARSGRPGKRLGGECSGLYSAIIVSAVVRVHDCMFG